MAKWLLIPIKDSGSGRGPGVGVAILGFFVGLMLLGLTGELLQVQVLGNTVPIAQRGVGWDFVIGGVVWAVVAAIIFAVRKLR